MDASIFKKRQEIVKNLFLICTILQCLIVVSLAIWNLINCTTIYRIATCILTILFLAVKFTPNEHYKYCCEQFIYFLFLMSITANFSCYLVIKLMVSLVLSSLTTLFDVLLAKINKSLIRQYESSIKLCSMDEQELRDFVSKELMSEQITQSVIDRLIHGKTWSQIQKENSFNRKGIRYHKTRIYKKLNVKL